MYQSKNEATTGFHEQVVNFATGKSRGSWNYRCVTNLDFFLKKWERAVTFEPKNPESHFHLALIYHQMDDFGKAIKEYETALTLKPKWPLLHFLLGILYARFGKADLASREWEVVLDLDLNFPQKIPKVVSEEIPFNLPEQTRAAVEALRTPAAVPSVNAYIHYQTSFALGICGMVQESLEEYQKAITISPVARGMMTAGRVMLANGRADLAVKILEESVKLQPNIAEAHLYLGIASLQQEKILPAIRSFERAIQYDSRSVKSFAYLGAAQAKQGRHDLAATNFQKAIALDPAQDRLHFSLAQSYEAVFNLDGAVSQYREVVRLNPSLFEAQYNLGLVLGRLGKHHDALEPLKKAVLLSPDDPYAHYHLGLSLNQLGKYEEAIPFFRKSLELNPKDSYTHYHLGIAYENLDNLVAAVDEYQQALRINPEDSYAHYHLGLTYLKDGQYTLAQGEFLRVLEMNPNDAYAYYNLGAVYARIGLLDQAIEAYQQATSLNPNNPYAHFNLGAAYAREGAPELAAREFEEAIHLTPNNEAELALFSTLASQAAIAIEIATLNRRLKDVYTQTVRALAETLDAKDPYTAGHTSRVTLLSLGIAEELGLPSEKIEALRIASLLHDIGKIGIPDQILLKHGALTDEELERMREHPLIGARILSPIQFPWSDVISYVKHHHEKNAGGGYPEGLSGDEIPIGAKILALADFFDALATERPYKKALPIPVVMEEIEKLSGTHFDPEVVEALKRVAGDIAPRLYREVVPSLEEKITEEQLPFFEGA